MPTTLQQKQLVYSFGDYSLDTGRGALLKHGEEIRLRPQSFDVLRILLEQQGSLVTKIHLQGEIWGSKIVTDDSLTHCLLDIRKALSDTDKSIIRTVPRRGYIFESPCTVEESMAPEKQSRRGPGQFTRGMVVAIAATTMVIAVSFAWLINLNRAGPVPSILKNSVAVLPFADTSESQNQQYLGDGISDDVLNLLARSSELRVIARTSSFSFADKVPDIQTIRDTLNVTYVLEGSVRRTGDQLIVTAQLVDTANSANIWSERYEQHADNLFIVQNEIAQAVLLKIAPAAEASPYPPAIQSFSANELMFLARFLERDVRERPEVNQKLLDRAISLYRDAIQADPNSALAYSRLGGALLYGGQLSAAEEPILKSVELDPNISDVQKTLGDYYWVARLPGAGAAWNRAIDLNPNNADALSAYGYWYWMQANDDRPEEMFRRAMELDPLSLSRHAALGEFYANEARVGDTKAIVERIKRQFDSAAAYRVIARLYELIGEIDRSIAWTIKARDRQPDNGEHVAALAELYAEIGDFDTAVQLAPEQSIGLLYKMRRYDEMIEIAELRTIDEPNDIYLHHLLAFAYTATGNSEGAIRILRRIGQPNAARAEAKHPVDLEAFVTYVDALDASGASNQASELARWFESARHTKSDNWWIHVYRACALAVQGRDELALQSIERVTSSPRLPWDTTLKDSRCFARFQNEARYLAVLDQVDSRRRNLRERLSVTLSAYAVVL